MTGMEHTIEQAAQVVEGILGADPQIAHEMRGDEPDKIARALASAGILAPAPLREEWAVEMGTDGPRELFPSRAEAQAFAHDDETVLHRYRTDWTPVDRAEGDGSAEQ